MLPVGRASQTPGLGMCFVVSFGWVQGLVGAPGSIGVGGYNKGVSVSGMEGR